MDSPKQLTPKDVEEAVSQLRRQLQGVTQSSLERIDCSPETIEQGLAKLVLPRRRPPKPLKRRLAQPFDIHGFVLHPGRTLA